MIRLLMLRHGQTIWNAQRRYQGQSDVPLDETGLRQVQTLARHFASQHVDAIYSSDLQRAMQTAQPVAAALGKPVVADSRLREVAFGAWEGLTYLDIQKRWPDEYAAWQHDPVTHIPPGGENLAQVAQRVGAVVDEIRQKNEGQTVLLVAHGGALRAIICHALELPSHAFWRLSLSSGSLSELKLYSDTAVLTLFNDAHVVDHHGANGWVGRPDGDAAPPP